MTDEKKEDDFKPTTKWVVVLIHIYVHISAFYGLFLIFSQAYFKTTLYLILLVSFGILGVTAGAHRLWSHQTYQAVWPVRLFLALMHTLSCQGPIYDWVLDHRLHHKHFGTNYDRYNYKRGFIFAHIASRHVTENPVMKELAKEIDMTDIEKDQIVMYQKRFYWLIMPIFSLLLPVNAAVEYWGESMLVAVFVIGFLRIALLLHAAWFITSASIVWGSNPLDKKSGETVLVFFINKSLWPQYHYLLPWDYQSGEYGTYGTGCSTAFIRVLAALGLANSLSTITTQGVRDALATAAENKKPLVECLNEAKTTAKLADILSPEVLCN